jgi:invasion protein IalB
MTLSLLARKTACLITLAALCVPLNASAQQRAATRTGSGNGSGNAWEFGKSGAWTILRAGEGRGKSCFIMTQPAERTPKGLTRDPAYVYVLMRQGEATKPEFQVLTGYPLKAASEAQISIGGQTFAASGADKTLWLKNPAEETRLVNELRRATTMTIKGTSLRGNDTTDRYSVTGFGQALERAQKECS